MGSPISPPRSGACLTLSASASAGEVLDATVGVTDAVCTDGSVSGGLVVGHGAALQTAPLGASLQVGAGPVNNQNGPLSDVMLGHADTFEVSVGPVTAGVSVSASPTSHATIVSAGAGVGGSGVAANSTTTVGQSTDLLKELKEQMLRAMVCPPSMAPYSCPIK